MPLRTEHSAEIETVDVEISTTPFDRLAFARRAVELVRPRRTVVAFCEGAYRVRVEVGRQWGKGEGERWAIVSVPKTASRRSIALAIAALGSIPPEPYALDALLHEMHES